MTFGERIFKTRTNLGMTQEELAKLAGYKTRSAIAKIESGERDAPQSVIVALAKALNTTPAYLMGWENSEKQSSPQTNDILFTKKEKDHIKKYRSLDDHGKRIIDYNLNEEYSRCMTEKNKYDKPETISIKLSYLPASAGTGVDLYEENYTLIEVKANELTRITDFAVKVSGDSMEPTYHDGDILLINSMPYINIGDVGVFVLNGDGYVKEFGGNRLISHNKKYPDIKLSEHDVVICSGKVIGVLDESDLKI